MKDYPNAGVDVFIEFSQTDAGSRCAGICAASMALADAGIMMKDLVGAVAVGIVGETVLIDLDYVEEAHEEDDVADIPLAIIPSTGDFTLLQMDGKIKKADLIKAIEMGKKGVEQIVQIQRKALQAKFQGEYE